ncbi:MAG: ribonuclease HI [Alphaproteobacteria bacterium]|nr:ribonuclease HI [Alphaproteobacteria bacterium]OJV15796.1 MAG: ribonuclease HI [Alphaproteobacteria bacterium 33-17]
MKKVVIYTDGSCLGNPGAGAWAAILEYQGKEKEICGFVAETTNNRMELMAAIEALKTLKESCIVELYTDSRYVQQGITEWLPKWRQTNFKNKKNVDLWIELEKEAERHKVSWHWVQAHSTNALNNRVDKLARDLAIKNSPKPAEWV